MINLMSSILKDFAVTFIGTKLYLMRRSGIYKQKKKEYRELWKKSLEEQQKIQTEKLLNIFKHAKNKSRFYSRKYANFNEPLLSKLPFLEKEELREKIDEIVIGNKNKYQAIYTGGTTGKGLVVYLKPTSLQDRFSILDLFLEAHGYRFRKKTAWFSGRKILYESDKRNNVFWRTNYFLNIRYYSSFNINQTNLPVYIENLNKYHPEFIVSFPSSVYELARYMQTHSIKPGFQLKTIFTTAETLYVHQREIIEEVFNCKVRNQYASSEGAPFIIECSKGNLHMEFGSGIIEVLDENNKPANEGLAVVTSFMNKETPLIRYKIGDRLKLSDKNKKCSCGWNTPMVEEIIGRDNDYIDIPGKARVWNIHFGDCLKGIKSIINFQVELVEDKFLNIYLVADKNEFDKKDKEKFLKKLKERIGDFPVKFSFVEKIAPSKSGKHLLIKK